MAMHHFTPEHYYTALGTYAPVLRIADGDTVITTTVDAGGADATNTQVTPGGNPQTGPFYVEGADPAIRSPSTLIASGPIAPMATPASASPRTS